MADAYVATIYASAAATVTAINAVAADKLVSVVSYQEGGKWKFIVTAKV